MLATSAITPPRTGREQMPSYVLRDLPPEVWEQFRARASAEGWPLRALFLELIREYASGAISPTVAPIPMPRDNTDR